MRVLDILILAAVLLLAALAAGFLYRHRGGCRGCGGCSGCSRCHRGQPACPIKQKGGESHADAP